jgi:hypothetical protein
MPAFAHDHYVPLLKGKAGEFDALRHTAPATRGRLTPLIEVVEEPWDWDDDVPRIPLEDHLERTVSRLADAWGGEEELFVELRWLDPDARTTRGSHPVEAFFTRARGRLEAIPVTQLGRDADHQAAITDVVAADARGLCLRLDNDDLLDLPATAQNIDDLLATVALAVEDVDLVVDLGPVDPGHAAPVQIAAGAVLPALPYLADWRTLTLASGAFPENLSGFARNNVSSVERADWSIWSDLVSRNPPLPRLAAFGDYAIAHPDHALLDPRFITPNVAIRYTLEDRWLIVKRESTKKGFPQFFDAAAILAARPEFLKAGHCWGDQYISECAARTKGPGRLQDWRAVGTNHHVALTVEQIANLP